jgi:uncharacterized protein YjiK
MKFSQVIPLLFLVGSASTGLSSCSPNQATASEETNLPLESVAIPGSVTVAKKWTLPADLLEISGISWVDDKRIACVQDEDGSLFIYNLSTSQIEKSVPFAGPGDYESVTRAGDHFYVLRSDGHLFEVDPRAETPLVRETDLDWSGKHDIEAMSYDAAGKRLLLADKREKKGDIRHIYAYDLASDKMLEAPVLELDLTSIVNDEKAEGKKGDGKRSHEFLPSDLAIDAKTGDYYLTDGKTDAILVVDKAGSIKKFVKLNSEDFPQLEGLTISPSGQVYVSSEGAGGEGVLARVAL